MCSSQPDSMNGDSQMHNGHRERLKKRFLAEGLDNFEPHAILEMILFYSVPRRDTNPIAHRLLDYFGGSLMCVFDAPIEELVKVEGIGINTATLIKLFPEVCRRYLMEMRETGQIIKSSKDAAKCFIPMFIGRTNEFVAIMCIDAKGKLLFCNNIFEGTVNAASVNIRRFVEIAVRYAATDIIMAHNHPGGLAIPSEQDISVTQKVSEALKTVNINLLDHIIVSGSDWVSLAATPTVSNLFPNRNGFNKF
jgi:DNA repair protein RadC